MTDVVEAMARGMMDAGCPVGIAHDLARAAIRACHAAGSLVVGKMPTTADQWDSPAYDHGTPRGIVWADGHNAALAEVRAAAVVVE